MVPFVFSADSAIKKPKYGLLSRVRPVVCVIPRMKFSVALARLDKPGEIVQDALGM